MNIDVTCGTCKLCQSTYALQGDTSGICKACREYEREFVIGDVYGPLPIIIQGSRQQVQEFMIKLLTPYASRTEEWIIYVKLPL